MGLLISVAGDDPGSGVRAGLQADAEMARRMGLRFLGIVAVETKQGADGLRAVRSRPADEVGRQLREAMTEAMFTGEFAIKTGALGDLEIVRAVAAGLRDWGHEECLVVDPVRGASRRVEGAPALLDDAGWQAMQAELFPLACWVTPNQQEYGDGSEFSKARGVLLTGGDAETDEVVDRRVRPAPEREFRSPRLPGGEQLHGTGCRLSAALAAAHVRGLRGDAAIEAARAAVAAWMSEQLA